MKGKDILEGNKVVVEEVEEVKKNREEEEEGIGGGRVGEQLKRRLKRNRWGGRPAPISFFSRMWKEDNLR